MSLDCYQSAREMVAAVAAREVSARELLELHLAQVELANSRVNAVVSLDPERAYKAAAAADQVTAAGTATGALHGLPLAVKDTHQVAGWLTTFGSPLRRDFVPSVDDLVVERMRAAGVVIFGRTNVPEWAAGSHTFNPLFGTTYNPYDPGRSAGGSSGGAAAALACGMLPVADGSDMGGSLRNPASFCNVVGFRPSLGRVPNWPTDNAWETTSTAGPMARTVDDAALLLSVLAGPDPRCPQALGEPGAAFAGPVHGELAGARVALSADLGGVLDLDPTVASVVNAQADVLASAGAQVAPASPNLAGADEAFRILRAWSFWHRLGSLLRAHPDGFKESLADNIRAGANLTGEDVARAYATRTLLVERMRRFFSSYDVLALAASAVPPFPADQEYPTEVAGRAQRDYLDWMRSAYLITMTGCPAVSVPAGFTPEGLPVGIQLVGPPNGDLALLRIAWAFEQRTRVGRRRPRAAGTEGGATGAGPAGAEAAGADG